MNLSELYVDEKRFWKKVTKTNGCWSWNAARYSQGYGHFWVRREGKRLEISAHRIMFLLKHGSIPNGMCVCHRCDNPSCVNPDHLFLGTRGDNLCDCYEKHRREALTRDDVEVIRARALFESYNWLAVEYGVSTSAIYQVSRGEIKGW